MLHSFNVTDLKDMTVFQFQQFLWSQPDFLGKTDMICHEFECSKDKRKYAYFQIDIRGNLLLSGNQAAGIKKEVAFS